MFGPLQRRWHVGFALTVLITGVLLWFFSISAYENVVFYRQSTRLASIVNGSVVTTHSSENQAANKQPAITTQQCKPKDTVMFLKTHKTGSSTVTNILNRYGRNNNLVFALPKGDSMFAWPQRFRSRFTIETFGGPNILCNHARYNRKPLNLMFPKSKSTYLTIVREPLSHYESSFNYFELWKDLGLKGSTNLQKMENYLSIVSTRDSAKLSFKERSRLLRNPMLYDLGLDFRYYQDKKAVLDYINFLEKEFDLVMVMEYFDESAVLLKRLMCWDFDDVIFIKHNERQKKDKRMLSPSLKANIKSWNAADFMLYDHFNKTLWTKIAAEGPGFYDDLAQFRRRKKEVFDMCIGPKPVVVEIYNGKFVQGHGLKDNIPQQNKTFCSNLIKTELNFLYEIKAIEKKRRLEMDDEGAFPNQFDNENDWSKGGQDLKYTPLRPSELSKTTAHVPTNSTTHVQ